MKTLLILLAILSISLETKAQDTTKINFYIGLVGSGFVQKDSGSLTKWANLRTGIHYKEKIYKKISFDGRIGFDPAEKNIIFLSTIKTSWKNFGISAGYQPTPVSEIKPTPLSVDDQFRFTAEGIPPSGTWGTTIWYHNLKTGFYIRNKKPEYQLAYSNKIFSMGIWTNTIDSIKTFLGGATAKIKLPYIYGMVSITKDKQALALSVRPIKKIDYNIIWDLSYTNGNLSNNLIGVMYFFKTKKLTAARFGIGYDFITNSAGVFFLVGFNYKE
jgi:hypothetical protein